MKSFTKNMVTEYLHLFDFKAYLETIAKKLIFTIHME